LEGLQCGYMLDDSGPIFPSDGPSAQLHAKIRESWDMDPMIIEMEDTLGEDLVDELLEDFGSINTVLADRYPRDRLSIAYFRLDLNYSLYSYERFYDFPPTQDIHDMWWEDTEAMMLDYDAYDNLSYFIPYYRSDNCSHCLGIMPMDHILEAFLNPTLGTEIQEENIHLGKYIKHLLDDEAPLKSYLESVKPNEGFSEAAADSCR